MKKTYLSLIVGLLVGIFPAWSIPANPYPIEMEQPDGSKITIKMIGDEYGHYEQTEDGISVMRGEDGFFRYAELSSAGELQPGAVIARNANARSEADNAYLANLPKQEYLVQQFETSRLIRKQALQNTVSPRAIQASGTVRGLVLLVQFSDEKFTHTNADFYNMMNQEGYDYNGAVGSVRDYFIAQSGGKFTPIFDVYGPFTLSSESYYGADSNGVHDPNFSARMPSDACDAANSSVDFSKYDADGDGYVDLLYIIYAGYSQSSSGNTNDIWPKSGTASTGTYDKWDGKKISRYACSSELKGKEGTTRDGIGTFIHEYSHTLGLPDFYDTGSDGITPYGMGYWDIMCYGGYRGNWGVGYTAYERTFCGWMSLTELPTTGASLSLENLADSHKAYKMTSSDANQYFILENRQKTGWDAYLPGAGLMITKVDYNSSIWAPYGTVGTANTVNVNPNRQRMTIMPADNELSIATESGDLYPYNGNNSFTSTSSPASTTNTAGTINRPVTYITNDNGTIIFEVNGGGNLSTPTLQDFSNVVEDGFTVNWGRVDGATSYNVKLSREVLSGVNGTNTTETYDAVGTSYTFADMPKGYTYIVQVQAESASGLTGGYSSSKSLILEPAPAADVPVALEATNVTASRFVANWEQVTEEVSGYILRAWRTDLSGNAANDDDWPQEITVDNRTTSYQFKRLDLNTYNYFYQVKTLNYDNVESSYSNTIMVSLNPTTVDSYAVTFAQAANGSFEVRSGGTAIVSGTEVLAGTTLTIEVTPNAGYELDAITVNGSVITGNTFTVSAVSVIRVTFKEVETIVDYVIPSGSMHSNSTTYVEHIYTENADTDINKTWSGKPDNVYQLLDQTLIVALGETFNLHLDAHQATSLTNSVYQDLRFDAAVIFVDWEGDGTFEKLIQIGSNPPESNTVGNTAVLTINQEITVPTTANLGECRIRVIYNNAWQHDFFTAANANTTNIVDGMAYDIPVKVIAEKTETPVDYVTPSGSMHSNSTTYVEHIYTENADTDINKTWSGKPDNVYQLLDQTLLVDVGQKFNLHLDAYQATSLTNGVYQDLRFDAAVIFVDWDGDGNFEKLTQIGLNPPTSNTVGNIDVLTINQEITVPTTAKLGECRIRVIYNNAWQHDFFTAANANTTGIVEGMAYDIPVKVNDPNAVDKVEVGHKIYVSQGNIVVESEGEQRVDVINITGQVVHSTTVNGQAYFDVPARGIYIVRCGTQVARVVVQ